MVKKNDKTVYVIVISVVVVVVAVLILREYGGDVFVGKAIGDIDGCYVYKGPYEDFDADGLLNCVDPDCDGRSSPGLSIGTCEFSQELSCSDGFNNDGVESADFAEGTIFRDANELWEETQLGGNLEVEIIEGTEVPNMFLIVDDITVTNPGEFDERRSVENKLYRYDGQDFHLVEKPGEHRIWASRTIFNKDSGTYLFWVYLPTNSGELAEQQLLQYQNDDTLVNVSRPGGLCNYHFIESGETSNLYLLGAEFVSIFVPGEDPIQLGVVTIPGRDPAFHTECPNERNIYNFDGNEVVEVPRPLGLEHGHLKLGQFANFRFGPELIGTFYENGRDDTENKYEVLLRYNEDGVLRLVERLTEEYLNFRGYRVVGLIENTNNFLMGLGRKIIYFDGIFNGDEITTTIPIPEGVGTIKSYVEGTSPPDALFLSISSIVRYDGNSLTKIESFITDEPSYVNYGLKQVKYTDDVVIEKRKNKNIFPDSGYTYPFSRELTFALYTGGEFLPLELDSETQKIIWWYGDNENLMFVAWDHEASVSTIYEYIEGGTFDEFLTSPSGILFKESYGSGNHKIYIGIDINSLNDVILRHENNRWVILELPAANKILKILNGGNPLDHSKLNILTRHSNEKMYTRAGHFTGYVGDTEFSDTILDLDTGLLKNPPGDSDVRATIVDHLTDCADPDCEGLYCDYRSTCQNNVCIRETEDTCDNYYDDDGDYLSDCEDPDCDALSCGSQSTCQNNVCVQEEVCDDYWDNNNDGLEDCADPDCDGLACDFNAICRDNFCVYNDFVVGDEVSDDTTADDTTADDTTVDDTTVDDTTVDDTTADDTTADDTTADDTTVDDTTADDTTADDTGEEQSNIPGDLNSDGCINLPEIAGAVDAFFDGTFGIIEISRAVFNYLVPAEGCS